jgi:hypothetical protein
LKVARWNQIGLRRRHGGVGIAMTSPKDSLTAAHLVVPTLEAVTLEESKGLFG